jgi:two-component system, OmpR family, alkaline phosphatase synthesis response regulator PhoP
MAEEKILIVDDEANIRELIGFNLKKEGYDIFTAGDGLSAIKIIKEEKPALILLDLMLPGMNGFEVCKEVRKDSELSSTPIIILSAKDAEFDKVLGLELGADDYMTKPFSVRELVARVKAVLRRTSPAADGTRFTFLNISVDFDKHEVKKDGHKVDLTLKEFELLEILVKNKGRVMTRDFLLDKVWGYEYAGETRTVDVHIRHLRQKIEDDDKNPRLIETIRGVGYRFNSEELR